MTQDRTFENSNRVIFTSGDNFKWPGRSEVARVDGLGRPTNRAIGSTGINQENMTKTRKMLTNEFLIKKEC